jgi:hypothetical protein
MWKESRKKCIWGRCVYIREHTYISRTLMLYKICTHNANNSRTYTIYYRRSVVLCGPDNIFRLPTQHYCWRKHKEVWVQ